MEDSAYCRADYVAIGGRREANKKRICGQQSYRVLELATPENYLEPWVLEFRSDSAGHQRGFNIKATQILCSELGNLGPIINVTEKLEQDPSMPNSALRCVSIRFRFRSAIISPESQVFILK